MATPSENPGYWDDVPPLLDEVEAELSAGLLAAFPRATAPRLFICGANKSGKSAALSRLVSTLNGAEDLRVAYWSLASEPPASEGAATRRLMDLFGSKRGEDVEGALWQALSVLPPRGRAVLVLDHWDEALEAGHGAIDVVKNLVSFASSRTLMGPAGQALGVVLASRFPSVKLLAQYSSVANNPGLIRISGLLRDFKRVQIPMLSEVAALAHVEARAPDLDAETRRQVVKACGGWLGLINESLDVVSSSGTWDNAVERRAAQAAAPLFNKTLLWSIRAAHELPTLREARRKVLTDIALGYGTPEQFGLPTAYGGASTELAPLVDTFLRIEA